ncbi:MAG: heterodisulfide reductase, subunit B [Candidatus Cloacimonadota bacterium]|nr:MAG: heterodisulfide reductase, subunit B [Candidatus Cloacimonadota bacterium]
MKISYYPGCTVKTSAKNLENSALPLLGMFDIQTEELDDWYCCGVTFSQSADNLMYQLAPIRTLVKAKESGNKRLLTLCDMCYNTLKRSSLVVKNDPEKQQTIRDFMYLEKTEFKGDEIEIIHILSLLREIGAEEIKKRISRKVNNLKVAPYYGCMILRPREIAIDSAEDPRLMENILNTLGIETVDYPFRSDCCTSYQIVNEPEIVKAHTKKLVNSIKKRGGDIIVLSCPLCHFNIDEIQKQIAEEDESFETIPVLYFTQLLALLVGIDPNVNDFSLHYIDPRPVLERKGLL